MYELNKIPSQDRSGSEVSNTIFDLAQNHNLMFFNFEYRKALDYPEDWMGDVSEEWGGNQWLAGKLPESKYQNFRTDLLIGSFHPNHHSKWSAHELLHNIVGFGYNPQWTFLEHCLSSRLSELLPVVQYHFLDEARTNKCMKHNFSFSAQGQNCQACDLLAKEMNPSSTSSLSKDMAEEFFTREIAAIKSSLKSGLPVENQFFHINLSTDSYAYVKNHWGRLQDPLFAKFVDQFYKDTPQYFTKIDDQIQRVEDVFSHLMGRSNLATVSKILEVNTWITQDIGFRLLQMQKMCEEADEVFRAIEKIVFGLLPNASLESVEKSIQSYVELCKEYELIPAEELFAVGYELPMGFGFAKEQVLEGLKSAIPNTLRIIGPTSLSIVVEDFIRRCEWTRNSLAPRFTEFLKSEGSKELSEMGELENAISSLKLVDVYAQYWNPTHEDQYYLSPNVYSMITKTGIFEQLSLDFADEFKEGDLGLLIKPRVTGELDFYPLEPELYEKVIAMNFDFKEGESIFNELLERNFIIGYKSNEK
ncbi:MAG: hypothetical protein AB8E15_01540 [Bdellovibrionales bacterium]